MRWNKKCQKWEALAHLGRKQRYLGLFAEEADAAEAVAVARAAHGEGRLDDHLETLRLLKQKTGRKGSVRGVSWNKRNRKWEARPVLDGKCPRLGHFVEEADRKSVV